MFNFYGLIVGAGMLTARQVSLGYAKGLGVKKELVERAFWWVVIGGIIGARLYHAAHLWQEVYSLEPVSVFYIWNGGLGIWGGIIGGVVGLVGYYFSCHPDWSLDSYRRRNRDSSTLPTQGRGFGRNDNIKFLNILDVAVIGVPLGQAIGRLGNWVNGELYGRNGEPLWAIEAALNLVLFVLLWRIGKKKTMGGKITGVYLVGYGVIRILLESFRPEEIVWKWQRIPVAMIFGTVSVVVGVTISILRLMARHDPRG